MVHALCNRWRVEGLSVILATDSADAAYPPPRHGTSLNEQVTLFARPFPNPLLSGGRISVFLRRIAWYARGSIELWRLLRHRHVDLVHLHMVNIDVLLLAAFKRVLGYRLVITFTGVELHLAESSLLSRLKLRIAVAAADGVTAVSREICTGLESATGRAARCIPNGIDMPEASRALGCVVAPGHFVFCGRLAPVKRVPFLIEAFSVAVRHGCSRNLYIIGTGEEEHRVRETIARHRLEGRVVMVGPVDPETAVDAMRGSCCVVLASATEGHPLVLLEAMLVGRPVIAPDVGGIREIVDHGRNGWLFDVDDRAGLTTLLTEADGDAARVAHAGAEAFRTAERLGFERMATEYLGVYDDVLSQVRAA